MSDEELLNGCKVAREAMTPWAMEISEAGEVVDCLDSLIDKLEARREDAEGGRS